MSSPGDLQKNQRYGRWSVVRAAARDSHGRLRAVVRCLCGTEAIVLENALRRGNTSGCKSVTCRKSWEASHVAQVAKVTGEEKPS